MYQISKKGIFVILAILVFFSSCSTISTSIKKEANFNISELYESKTGILPTVAGEGTRHGLKNMNKALDKNFRNKLNEIGKKNDIVFYKKMKLNLMDKKLLEAYVKVQKTYYLSGILDVKIINQIGHLLKLDYLVIPIAEDEQYILTPGSRPSYEIKARIIIYSVKDQKEVWSISIKSKSKPTISQGSFEEAYEKASKKFVEVVTK